LARATAARFSRGRAVADALAVEKHRSLVLLALADDDDAIHRHAMKDHPHGIHSGAVRALLVPATHPAACSESRSLGHSHQFHREVPVRFLTLGAHRSRR
jgi:hypothetical protein